MFVVNVADQLVLCTSQSRESKIFSRVMLSKCLFLCTTTGYFIVAVLISRSNACDVSGGIELHLVCLGHQKVDNVRAGHAADDGKRDWGRSQRTEHTLCRMVELCRQQCVDMSKGMLMRTQRSVHRL